MLFEGASSKLKRDRSWLIAVVLVAGLPTRTAPCRDIHSELVLHQECRAAAAEQGSHNWQWPLVQAFDWPPLPAG